MNSTFPLFIFVLFVFPWSVLSTDLICACKSVMDGEPMPDSVRNVVKSFVGNLPITIMLTSDATCVGGVTTCNTSSIDAPDPVTYTAQCIGLEGQVNVFGKVTVSLRDCAYTLNKMANMTKDLKYTTIDLMARFCGTDMCNDELITTTTLRTLSTSSMSNSSTNSGSSLKTTISSTSSFGTPTVVTTEHMASSTGKFSSTSQSQPQSPSSSSQQSSMQPGETTSGKFSSTSQSQPQSPSPSSQQSSLQPSGTTSVGGGSNGAIRSTAMDVLRYSMFVIFTCVGCIFYY